MWTNAYNGEQYYPHIEIDLEPGIYVFSKMSATGKTRLYKALVDVKRYRDTVAYTYEIVRTLKIWMLDMTSVILK